jgi:DNA-binding PucR family transcriptional regulator
MADARSSENSAHEGDLRGAADAAPRSTTPLKLVEASIAGLEALVAEAQRLAEDISEAELSGDADAGAENSGQAGAAATLLDELRDAELAIGGAEEETYRLLAGVLLHNPQELQVLREHTIAPLETYDAAHETELVATLERFLSHHGSTTDTAEAMQLHRHTVGYRLARIQEVCGLSPYESDGRERLSLGLKAKRLLVAQERLSARLKQGGGPAGPTAPTTS